MESFEYPLHSEEVVREMVEREIEHLPKDDYLTRLRSGDLDLSARREALDWIWKACSHHRFRPLCLCLSMNYLDRFLSVHKLPKGIVWAMRLLAIACLSVAAKMEETEVPLSVDLQKVEPKFVFEAKSIQRMELLVLSALKWRMQVLTPCSFIDYFLSRITDEPSLSKNSIFRSMQLILSTIKGIDFLEFRPSEIAAAVAISVSGELYGIDIDKAISCFTHVEKGRVLKCLELMKYCAIKIPVLFVVRLLQGRVLKCLELMKDLTLISPSTGANIANASSVPQSLYAKRIKLDKGDFKA